MPNLKRKRWDRPLRSIATRLKGDTKFEIAFSRVEVQHVLFSVSGKFFVFYSYFSNLS
jgi:hypothetical protein